MTSLRYDPSHRPGRTPRHASAAGRFRREETGGVPGMLSIVIPARNEAENLPTLVREIADAFRPLLRGGDAGHRLTAYEIVIVDDGSTDGTGGVLNRLSVEHPELRPIRLERNVGQSAATVAGFRESRGEWIGMLDADLQNPPADLARLWDALPGHDAVLGWRATREDVWSKRIVSRWANRIRNALLGQSIRDTGCSVRILHRDAALRLPTFQGFHRFLGPLLLREGCEIRQVPVSHRRRVNGRSNYNIWNRSTRVVVDLLGVAWLMRRGIRYEIAATGDPLEPASRVPGPHLSRSTFADAVSNRQEAA